MVAELSPKAAAEAGSGGRPVGGPVLLMELQREAERPVALARDTVRGFLAEVGEAAEDVVLVASELVANAVRHAQGVRFWLMLARMPGACTVTVEDEGPKAGRRPVFPSAVRSAEALWAESGRGLAIVAALCPEDHGAASTAQGSVAWGTVRWGGDE